MKLLSIDTAIGIAIGVALVACVASHSQGIAKTRDGRAHLAYSAVGAAVADVFIDDPLVSAGAMFAVGVLKEVKDAHSKTGDASWADLRADLWGSVIGAYSSHFVRGLLFRPSFNDGRLNGLTIAYTTEF